MAQAGIYNFVIEQNAAFHRDFYYKDPDGNVINLTGYDAKMQVRESKDDSTTILDLSVGNGLTIDGAAGKISLDLTDEQTDALDFSNAVYDMKLIPGSGLDERFLEGMISLSRKVTN